MYDPLKSRGIPAFHEFGTASYWAAVTPFPDTNAIALPSSAEVVVIGAGYTGLNAAIEVAQAQQREVVLIDAGGVGAGASSRNAGFLLPGTGRLGYRDYAKKFGEQIAQGVQNEFAASIEHVKNAAADSSWPCELIPARYLRLGHSEKAASVLREQQPAYGNTLLTAEWLSPEQQQAELPGLPWKYGGLSLTPAAAVNPRALTAAYLSLAQQAGVKIVTGHPVTAWRSNHGKHQLTAGGREIQCHQVLLCSNGYLPQQPFPDISKRQFPVLSSIVVSRPLNAAEQQYCGLTVNDLVMDTRTLKYYYRLLPDGRILFGGRGAVAGKNADNKVHRHRLEQALAATFPQLKDLYVDYFWSGWISVALDAMPRIFSPALGVFTSAGYCGAGVAFASLAGKRLAQLSFGERMPALPFYQSPLPRYPLAPARRVGLRALYTWHRWRG
ncbi:NAD(P)/FAD-dependent oxidoreductase [Aliidiomarina iranensis]|uniref:NAD(P)/FAD-dependent oxidoreductase n=1 Tax=Aliidiomarina iranensis TaxID=1434071 RepID=UPI0013006447|nr:FAD-dependent oxidoreductase [Aliidiomarina iranensis]